MTGASGRRGLPAALLIALPSLLAPLAVLLGAAGGRFIQPLAAALAVHPFMALLVLRRRRGAAIAAVLLWAAVLSATQILVSARDPAAASATVLGGEAYREEMFAFLRSGEGREAEPARFVPQHAAHLAGFGVLTLLSGGFLGIVMGAVLVGYMSHYVGALAAAGGAPALAYAFGWPPWAVLRVIAFVILGVLLSGPGVRLAARRLGHAAEPEARIAPWILAAAVLLLADLLLKAALARTWAGILRRCLPPAL
ncbi:MAG: hypothetical protein ACRD6R_06370 [Candidatus Polarisedimenticolia bacterium]